MLLNKELVTNGDFAAWTDDDPDDWDVVGEVTTDPEISEVGTGEGHGGVGTGMCNIYTSDATAVSLGQIIFNLVVGRKYRFSIKIDTVIANGVTVYDTHADNMFPNILYTTAGIKTFIFVALRTSLGLGILRNGTCNITIDNISIRADVPAELSRTGQRFSSHQEM